MYTFWREFNSEYQQLWVSLWWYKVMWQLQTYNILR